MIKKINCIFLCIVLLLSYTAFAQNKNNICGQLIELVPNPEISSIGGEWTVLALARSNGIYKDYFNLYYQNVCDTVKRNKGVIHERKYTEYARVALAITAIGRDPRDVCGYNLLEPLADFEKTAYQGINGAVFALLAFDSRQYEIPVCAEVENQATREKYINEILNWQQKDGRFSMGQGSDNDIDITAMSIQALAKYTNKENVAVAVDNALRYLSDQQDNNGGFGNSESVAQTIMALCELGIDIHDKRFIKNGISLYDNLLTYQNQTGFLHMHWEDSSVMAAEQAACALSALSRIQENKSSFFDMKDVTTVEPEKKTAEVITPSVNSTVKFNDIQNHINQKAIEYLASAGVIIGISETEFAPDKNISRAEFAAIVVRALKLTGKSLHSFADVPSGSWCEEYISCAYENGIIKGVSDTNFSPNNTITKEEAAVMLARAAKIEGQNVDMTETQIRDMLAQFEDYTKINTWAKAALAYCYKSGIFSQEELLILPQSEASRCDVAQMVYNLLTV